MEGFKRVGFGGVWVLMAACALAAESDPIDKPAPDSAPTVTLAKPPANARTPTTHVVRLSGKVLVKRGTEFMPAKKGMPLQVGDQVNVLDNATITIVHADGCEYKLIRSQIATIDEDSPCHPAKLADGTGGNRPVTSDGADATPPVVAVPSGSDAWEGVGTAALLAVPAAALVLAVAGAHGGSSGQNSKPLSP